MTEHVSGVVTAWGSEEEDGRDFTWITLNQGKKGPLKVIGYSPEDVGGPGCYGLSNVAGGMHLRISGKREGSVFLASSVARVATPQRFGGTGAPHLPTGPRKRVGTVVVYRSGRRRDWLEVVEEDGEQVPVTLPAGSLDRGSLGKRYLFTGHVTPDGFWNAHCAEAVDKESHD